MRTASVTALALAAVLLMCSQHASAFLPVQNPRWAPTWDIRLSSLAMLANFSGPLDINFAKNFGLVSIDWSNDKFDWVLQHPMDDEERMVATAAQIKAASPFTRVFVYRNLVKALAWWTSVRKIIEDPAYAGFFLKFKPNATYHVPACTTQNNVTKCSEFYHDQTQSPDVPSPSDPNPDGACNISCDCGKTLPCGEYLWDHRNESLTAWLKTNFIISNTSVGSPVIDGLFIDDFWCSYALNGSCGDPTQGPTEVDAHSQEDMGLSDQDVVDIQKGWLKNMEMAQSAILEAGGFTWSLMQGQANANAGPYVLYNSNDCKNYLSGNCVSPNPNENAPFLFGLQGKSNYKQQTAAFLLSRGPFAWIGWGQWGLEWPPNEPLPDVVFNADYGVPLEDSCYPVSSNVYQRKYSKYTVTVDCNAWTANFTPVS